MPRHGLMAGLREVTIDLANEEKFTYLYSICLFGEESFIGISQILDSSDC